MQLTLHEFFSYHLLHGFLFFILSLFPHPFPQPHHFSNTVRPLTETENKRICRMSRLNSGSDRLRKIQVEVAQTS